LDSPRCLLPTLISLRQQSGHSRLPVNSPNHPHQTLLQYSAPETVFVVGLDLRRRSAFAIPDDLARGIGFGCWRFLWRAAGEHHGLRDDAPARRGRCVCARRRGLRACRGQLIQDQRTDIGAVRVLLARETSPPCRWDGTVKRSLQHRWSITVWMPSFHEFVGRCA
jgi:hypothetical protein